jgi:hypothetical protein
MQVLSKTNIEGSKLSFVYVLEGRFHQPCLLRRLAIIDTTLVGVTTDKDLNIVAIW